MFTRIKLENIGPYTEEVTLNFVCDKRNKNNSNSIKILPDEIAVTKIAGIIGGNANGKTTILEALNSIGSFISAPHRKKRFPDKSDFDFEEIKEEFIEGIYNRVKKRVIGFSLTSANRSKPDNVAKIYVEMYIDSGNPSTTGYYEYELKYKNDYLVNGIEEEKLCFRKKYLSKKKNIMFDIYKSNQSEIGYKLAYKQNILLDYNKAGINTEELERRMDYYEAFYNKYIYESSTIGETEYEYNEDYVIEETEEDSKLLEYFIRVLDNGVKKIDIDTSNANDKKLFAVYDDYCIRYDELSTATKKACSFTCDYIKSSKKGGVLLIDELDNSLNFKTVSLILNIYLKSKLHNQGQLIFTTNSSIILNDLRRDQIFIVEKKNNTPQIIRFSEFINSKTKKKVRADFSFSKAYKNNEIENIPLEENVERLFNYIENR